MTATTITGTALPMATMKLLIEKERTCCTLLRRTAGGGTRSALDSVFGVNVVETGTIIRAKQFSIAVLVSLSAVVLYVINIYGVV